MRLSLKLASAIMVLAIGGMLGACSDTEQVAGPPIPVLAEQGAGDLEPTQRFVPGPQATCACVQWSCMGDCGYDPPTDGRGACCVLYNCEQSTGVSKPSCSAPPDPCEPYESCELPECQYQPMSGEYGVDFCDPAPTGDYQDFGCFPPYGAGVCPAEFTCCYGGPYGGGPY